MWGEPSGGAILNGTTQNYIHVHNAALDFGTGNGSMEIYFKPDNITDANSFLINKETGGIGYGLEQRTNDLWLRFDDNSTDATAIIGTDVLLANTWYHAIVTLNRAGNATLYLNGVSRGTTAISSTTATVSNAGAYTIGSETGAIDKDYAGVISYDKVYNYVLTQTEVSRRLNNGQPHLYVEPYATKGASNTPIGSSSFAAGLDSWTKSSIDDTSTWAFDTDHANLAVTSVGTNATRPYITKAGFISGVIQKNKQFRIEFDYSVNSGTCVVSGFNTLGQALSAGWLTTLTGTGTYRSIAYQITDVAVTGLIIYFNGTSLFNLNITGIRAVPVGETFSIANTDWGASGAVCTIGGTKSIANATAYPIAVSGKYDARKTIAANYEFTGTAKVGSILKYVKITNTIADPDTISLGTSALGTQVLNAQVIGASSTVIANVDKWFSDSATQTLFLSGVNLAARLLGRFRIY